jgi:RNA polymerase sigma factor (sigma-70 family)
LKHWLGRLSAREREVLALRYGADLPTAEIARALDLSEANVLQISSRALRRLRRALESSEIAGSERISDSA